jgi:hypothetical protein
MNFIRGVRFEVLPAVTVVSAILWDVAPCSLTEVYQWDVTPCSLTEVYQCFGRTYCFHLQS